MSGHAAAAVPEVVRVGEGPDVGSVAGRSQEGHGARTCSTEVMGEVAPFLVLSQPVADGHGLLTGVQQRRDQVRADKAGTAGNQDH